MGAYIFAPISLQLCMTRVDFNIKVDSNMRLESRVIYNRSTLCTRVSIQGHSIYIYICV